MGGFNLGRGGGGGGGTTHDSRSNPMLYGHRESLEEVAGRSSLICLSPHLPPQLTEEKSTNFRCMFVATWINQEYEDSVALNLKLQLHNRAHKFGRYESVDCSTEMELWNGILEWPLSLQKSIMAHSSWLVCSGFKQIFNYDTSQSA